MKGITINDLAVMCRQQQQLGNGEKYVLMSYSPLLYSIRDTESVSNPTL